MAKPILSCVVDRPAKFLRQAWIWMSSAKACGAFDDFDVVVHHVGKPHAALKAAAEVFGARLHEVAPFGPGPARFCNKLQSHPALLASQAPAVVLTDADLFFLQSPIEIVSDDAVRAKIVDGPNPPSSVITTLSHRFGLGEPPLNGRTTFRDGKHTHDMNCNGGVYAMSRAHLESIASHWRDYATQCLNSEDVLDRWIHHSDQLGFAFAMTRTETPFQPLPLIWNLPTHFPGDFYQGRDTQDAAILHYHKQLSPEGRLLTVGDPQVDAAIAKANAILDASAERPEFDLIRRAMAETE